MKLRDVPTTEIDAIAQRLATDLTANWLTIRDDLAVQLDVEVGTLDVIMTEHRQHILNLSYNYLSQGGKANN